MPRKRELNEPSPGTDSVIAVTADSDDETPWEDRQYQSGPSFPIHILGTCPTCHYASWLGTVESYDSDPQITCACGRTSSRLTLIKEALAQNDRIAWSFAACDFVIYDHFDMEPQKFYRYPVGDEVAKWLGVEVLPRRGVERWTPVVAPVDDDLFVSVDDSQQWDPQREPLPVKVNISWYRFGLQKLDAVPAWRQALFGASEIIDRYPAAALVLIASGFEAFFAETVRIRWQERGFRPGPLKTIIKGSITSLVDWLPSILDMPSLADDQTLYQQWKATVNERRNDVLHRALIHFTPEQALQSLRCALDSITYLDPLALVRPHVYYAGQ